MENTKKTFLLGVGCQKGGTSWLSNYLRKHPSSLKGFKKEYHIFDTVAIPSSNTWYLDAKKKKNSDRKTKLCVRFVEDFSTYFDYFEKRLELKNKIVARDFTPSYAGLPVHILQLIKDEFERRGIAVKVVFLMRDPFERVLSYTKKTIRQSNLDLADPILEQEKLISNYSSFPCAFRTQYEKTIENVERVFAEEDIFYGFYETLFSDETINRFTDFLQIPFKKGDYNTIKNPGQKSNTYNKIVYEKMIANFYRETYLFAFNKFGEDFIRDIWKSARHVK